MANLEQPSPKQVAVAAKNPMAYALVLVSSLLLVILAAYLNSNSGRNGDCNAQNAVLQKRIERLEAINDQFVTRDLQRDKEMSAIKHNTDSLIRATIGKKAKQLSHKH